MTAQVLFRTEPKLKIEATERLRAEGLTVGVFLNACLKEYLRGTFSYGLLYDKPEPSFETLEMTPKLHKSIKSIEDLVQKKYAHSL